MYKYLFVIIIFLFKTNFSFAQSQEEKWAIEYFEQKNVKVYDYTSASLMFRFE